MKHKSLGLTTLAFGVAAFASQSHAQLGVLIDRLSAAGVLDLTERIPIQQGPFNAGSTVRVALSAILAKIQPPGAAQLGGVFSSAPVAGQLVSGLDTSGNILRRSLVSGDLPSIPFSSLASLPTTLGGYGITDALAKTNNLSEVVSTSAARTNLGLQGMATQSPSAVGITGGSITNISFTSDVIDCAVNTCSNIPVTNRNKLRNSSLTQWYSGSGTFTVQTSGGWAAEGVFVVPSGVALTTQQIVNPLASPWTTWGLKINGASGMTDVKLRFVMESHDAAPFASRQVTCQFPIQNNGSGSVTPTITTKYPNTLDNFAGSTTDLGVSNLQTVASGATATLAYSFQAGSGAVNGYEVIVDLGALGTGLNIVLGGGFDCRYAPNVGNGQVSSPPTPDVRPAALDAYWCQRFREASYDNGIPAATVTNNGASMTTNWSTTSGAYTFGVSYKVSKRASITPTIFAPSNGASGSFTDSNAGAQAAALNVASQNGFYFTANSAYTPGGVGNRTLVHWLADASITGG